MNNLCLINIIYLAILILNSTELKTNSMHKLVKLFLQLLIAWGILQSVNLLIRHFETGVIDFTDLKNWKPWLLTFIVFAIFIYIRDKKR